jgi:hypothetical protein
VSEPPAFFVPEGGRLVASVSTRGPWSAEHQHGGPPAALLARALETLVGDDAALVRLTFDLLRPVPIAPLATQAEVTRAGSRVRRLQATLTAADGTAVVQAAALALRTAAVLPASIDDGGPVPPPVETATPFQFPFFSGPVGYHTAVETRIADGTWGKGPVTAWMRLRVPLVAGETTSPLQRLVALADSASGLAVVLPPADFTFVNADLTVIVHRPPVGEWLGIAASTVAEAHGVGVTRARLWDARGPVGASLQTCVIERRAR